MAHCKDFPLSPTLRAQLLKAIVDYPHGHHADDILRGPGNYFPSSAPVTVEERKLLVAGLGKNHSLALMAVQEFGGADELNCHHLSQDEAKILIPSAIEEILSLRQGQFDAEQLLENRKIEPLLSDEQRSQINQLVSQGA
jgi:hypothetical protein